MSMVSRSLVVVATWSRGLAAPLSGFQRVGEVPETWARPEQAPVRQAQVPGCAER